MNLFANKRYCDALFFLDIIIVIKILNQQINNFIENKATLKFIKSNRLRFYTF